MAKPDIRLVLEHYGLERELPEAYNWRPVRCVFHDEKNASASYISHDDSQGFNCHACGVSGDSISVIEKVEGLDFKEAMALAEQITGESFQSGPATPKRYKPMRLGESAPESRRQPSRQKRKRRRKLL